MANDSQDFSSPQEAIEGYLEALLQDVADYDEEHEDDEKEHDEELSVSARAHKSDHAHKELSDSADLQKADISISGAGSSSEGALWNTDENETRIFAPPSARAYAQEAAARIKEQRQQSVLPRTAVKEATPVVMPELKVAAAVDITPHIPAVPPVQKQVDPEVEVQTVIEEPVTDIATADDIVVSEPVTVTDEALEPVATVGVEQTDEQIEQQAVVAPATLENTGWTGGRPDWAQGRFECLLFDVKGLRLAVPLAELGGIHKLEKEPTPLFGQPGWFLGIVRANNMNLGLVDTAQWVMSERIDSGHKPDFRFAIRIHNSEWALACHEVAEAISLHPDEVKWRTHLGRRPWLAGTVVDHMCALIDVAAFARLLDSDKVPVDLQALMSDE